LICPDDRILPFGLNALRCLSMAAFGTNARTTSAPQKVAKNIGTRKSLAIAKGTDV
jgi:hypothetical protein